MQSCQRQSLTQLCTLAQGSKPDSSAAAAAARVAVSREVVAVAVEAGVDAVVVAAAAVTRPRECRTANGAIASGTTCDAAQSSR